jgi:hypothetical protein
MGNVGTIELLAVIASIGMLAAIVPPALARARRCGTITRRASGPMIRLMTPATPSTGKPG